MKPHSILSLIACVTCTALLITSCNKDKPEPDTESQTVIDHSMADAEFSYVQTEVNGVAINEKGLQKKMAGDTTFYNKGCNGCVQVLTVSPYDSALFPKSVTIDFGNNTTCVSCDGKIRKGKLMVSFSKPWKEAGAIATVTTENYYVNNNLIEAKVILTDINGIDTGNSSLNPKFNRQVMSLDGTGDAVITLTTGEKIRHRGNVTVEQTAGHSTPSNFSDDVITYYGTASGQNRKNRTYSVTIEEATKIRKASTCKWIEDGTMKITPNNLAERTIDFAYPASSGSGVCDGEVKITVNGNSFNVTLE
ncbi:MAG: hypothetical protein HYY40_14750 [Bacteroidetes bacterium]|nr:hypothetical protein [Bacteroidota bacterium]